MTGSFLSHRSLSGCPRANVTGSSAVALSARKIEELTSTVSKLNFQTMSPENGFEHRLPEEVSSPTHDDIRQLEDEIFELQEYSAKVEQDINRLRGDSQQLQSQTKIMERVSRYTEYALAAKVHFSPFSTQENESNEQSNVQMGSYYESLRNDFISLLGHVRLPQFSEEKPTSENFDSYLSRLQQLCVDSYRDENRSLFSSVRQALQDFQM